VNSGKSGINQDEREIVTTLLESKAVDFEAIGNTLARVGPSAALTLDYEDVFCGTMRTFVHVYRLLREKRSALFLRTYTDVLAGHREND
jgi:hypothetical protein